MPSLSKKTAAKQASADKKGVVTALAAVTLLRPLVTEKGAHMAEEGVYVFAVAKTATRIAVRQAFRDLYGVMPERVNIVRTHGKEIRFGRQVSRRADAKKAYIKLPADKTVDVFAV